jgi:PTH1 family peptidyl-tRNA hydrolase
MKYLIVGLGNPGSEYINTRHNIGFMVLDALAGASNAVFKSERLADVCEIKHKGRVLILVKPNTFMNLSGKAVNYWLQEENIPLENLLVITDDIALPFGKIRIRPSGSDGGHNGLKNINETLGHNNYARMRFGIGADFNKGQQAQYVLSPFTLEQRLQLPQRIKFASDAVLSFAFAGLQNTMNAYNNN